MGGEDEKVGDGGYGSVRLFLLTSLFLTNTSARMSVGLGMTSDEWKELRSKVDNSFWVMRVIGTRSTPPCSTLPDLRRPLYRLSPSSERL